MSQKQWFVLARQWIYIDISLYKEGRSHFICCLDMELWGCPRWGLPLRVSSAPLLTAAAWLPPGLEAMTICDCFEAVGPSQLDTLLAENMNCWGLICSYISVSKIPKKSQIIPGKVTDCFWQNKLRERVRKLPDLVRFSHQIWWQCSVLSTAKTSFRNQDTD